MAICLQNRKAIQEILTTSAETQQKPKLGRRKGVEKYYKVELPGLAARINRELQTFRVGLPDLSNKTIGKMSSDFCISDYQ